MGKGKGFIHEFEKFISRGNVMDMAVGVIIGGAFSSIITSLVDDILSPILGIFGGLNFDELSLNIMGDVTLKYGKFLTAVINFLIMALVIFCLVKAMNAKWYIIRKQRRQHRQRKFVRFARARFQSEQQNVLIVPLN